jgi:hypothetical protein
MLPPPSLKALMPGVMCKMKNLPKAEKSLNFRFKTPNMHLDLTLLRHFRAQLCKETDQLPAGVYLLQVECGNTFTTYKVVIQK